MPESYEIQYARHHNIPIHWIGQSEQLTLAAFLEWQVYTGTITVPDARRRYVANYPDSNRLPVGKTIIYTKDNTYEHVESYARGSVLSMIEPYEDSIREIGNL